MDDDFTYPITKEQQQDVERLQRYIVREQLTSVMSNTKWREAITVLLAIPDFKVRFRVQVLREGPADMALWEGSFPWHMPRWEAIEWLDIDPMKRISHVLLVNDREVDRSADVMVALHSESIPFSREIDAIRIWGYLRSGTSVNFIAPS